MWQFYYLWLLFILNFFIILISSFSDVKPSDFYFDLACYNSDLFWESRQDTWKQEQKSHFVLSRRNSWGIKELSFVISHS